MSSQLIELRQQLLRLEYEAVWTFETIAARSQELKGLASRSAAVHRSDRDGLRSLLIEADEKPVTPLPGYPSTDLVDAAKMKSAAHAILAAINEIHLEVIALTTAEERRQTIEQFTAVSVSLIDWGEQAQAFPGMAAT